MTNRTIPDRNDGPQRACAQQANYGNPWLRGRKHLRASGSNRELTFGLRQRIMLRALKNPVKTNFADWRGAPYSLIKARFQGLFWRNRKPGRRRSNGSIGTLSEISCCGIARYSLSGSIEKYTVAKHGPNTPYDLARETGRMSLA